MTYSGFYVMRTMLNLEEEKIENAHEYIWSHPGFAEFALDFIKEVLEIENLNELESLIKSPEERPSGVKLMPLGGKVVLGFNDMDKVLVKSRLPDRLVKSRKPFGDLKDAELINDTFIYAPEISSESMNWILHWSLREGAASRIHMQLASFQDFVESTLTRISRMLNEENSEIWDRERLELERIKSSSRISLKSSPGNLTKISKDRWRRSTSG